MFENRMLRRIFGQRRVEVTGGSRKLNKRWRRRRIITMRIGYWGESQKERIKYRS
jgi:hypothetical protein